ncbi:unnamed protein product [Mucor hiemalis]
MVNVYEALHNLGEIEKEGYIALNLIYPAYYPSSVVTTTGTIFPVFKEDNVDIMTFLSEKYPSEVCGGKFESASTFLDGVRISIFDNSNFVWACVMHRRVNNIKQINLPIYINGYHENEKISRFSSQKYCGVGNYFADHIDCGLEDINDVQQPE